MYIDTMDSDWHDGIEVEKRFFYIKKVILPVSVTVAREKFYLNRITVVFGSSIYGY